MRKTYGAVLDHASDYEDTKHCKTKVSRDKYSEEYLCHKKKDKETKIIHPALEGLFFVIELVIEGVFFFV